MSAPDAANLQAFFRGDAGLFTDSAGTTPASSDGNLVALWKDQSGNFNDLGQPSGGSRPIVKLAQINGLPCVRFDGSSQWMQFSNLFVAPAATLYAIIKIPSTGVYTVLCGDTKSLQWRIDGRKQRFVSALTADIGLGSTLITAATWTQVNASWDSATGAGVFRTASAVDGSVSATPPEAYNAFNRLGINASGSPTEWFATDIACLLVYNGVHDTTTRQAVEAFLTSIFGV